MRIFNSSASVWMVGLISGLVTLPISAELPTINEKIWLGYFVGFKNYRFQFGVTAKGTAILQVMGKKAQPLSKKLTIPVEFVVEKVMPDGKMTRLKILPMSLESTQTATAKPKDVVFQGRVKGDVGFEVMVSEEQGDILLGGRLLKPEKATSELRFSIRVKFPKAYADSGQSGDKKQVDVFKEKTQGDRLQLVWTDQKRLRVSTSEKIDASSKEINGPGIAVLQLAFGSYEYKKFELTATENSAMTLSNKPLVPLREGILVTWTADPSLDPAGKARLRLGIR